MPDSSHLASAAFPMGGGYFPMTPFPLSLEVIVEEPASRDERIDHAVNLLIPVALERKQGILVIQRDYGKFTVRVDQEVPCGVTHEYSHIQVFES
jgi:hypothetical protein